MSNGGSYDPRAVEGAIYAFWEKGGYFHAEPDPGKRPYVIDIPLPNVTGALHLGHALNNTIQDILIRHKRMCGYAAMWMPGTDHAGIATQAVVERKLKEEQNLTRHELGREGLVQKIWEWKEKYGEQILMQLRKMGCSCDWARTRFTLDEVCAKAVYEVFFQWFREGLIYRGTRLVNWDAHLQTAVADDEVIYETVQGHLWYVRYPIQRHEGTEARRHEGEEAEGAKDQAFGAVAPANGRCEHGPLARATQGKEGVDYLVVATTRPETMLGDTAVAVHPDDERYKHLIGKRCILPLMNRPIPIIADAILVKKEFGTGCVKVTPGHDPNDYEFAKRHGVPMINILTPDGKINENGRLRASEPPGEPFGEGEAPAEPSPRARGGEPPGGPGSAGASPSQVFDYVGLDRYEARKRVVADLEQLGLLEKIEPYETEIGHSDRSKTPIEPMLSEQWFVKMGELAEAAMEAVRDGRVRFFPERYAKTYLDWLGEKRDWCISRQLWWGHRIPVWTRTMHIDELVRDKRLAWLLDEETGPILAHVEELHGERSWHGWLNQIPWGEVRDTGRRDGLLKISLCINPAFAVRGETIAQVNHLLKSRGWPALKEQDFQPGGRASGKGYIERAESSGFVQDPDVLDTWFSSALWPFSTLGWPHDGEAQRHEGTKARSERSDAQPSVPACLRACVPSGADFEYFYPTSTLVTGRGIITLWVARMVMTGLHFTGRVPFQHVHIHPIILDGQGRIMSKSLGNGVDPLDIIELYGTDALRFTMAQMDTETQDVRMPVKPVRMPDGRTVNSSEKFELGRNFCNKIWQAATGFVLPNLEGSEAASQPGNEATGQPGNQATGQPRNERSTPGPTDVPTFSRSHAPTWPPRPLTAKDLALEDHWILSRLSACIADCDRRLERYQISEVANTLYSFFWSDFCDWYVELVKPRLLRSRDREGADAPSRSEAPRGELPDAVEAGAPCPGPRPACEGSEAAEASARVARQVLAWVLDQSLRLLHPLMPFVTEALWQRLNQAAPQRGISRLIDGEPALITAAWPDAAAWSRDPKVEAELAALQNVIRGLRDTLAWINTTRAAAKKAAIGKLPRAVIRAAAPLVAGLREQMPVICRLGRCEAIEIGAAADKPPESATKVFPGIELFVPIGGLAELAVERRRLARERDQLVEHIARLAAKLETGDFVAKAPPAVVERERTRQAELNEKLAALERHLAEIAN